MTGEALALLIVQIILPELQRRIPELREMLKRADWDLLMAPTIEELEARQRERDTP